MTNDEILRIAIECQLVTTENREGFYSEALISFAKLIEKHEREECAKIAEIAEPYQAADLIRAGSNT